ncbi:MAG TPA: CHAT domain-containing protein, partial [Opitutaceae bacterium]|nr:CHAT domain-containing protein [Opitutaceae bacterium]
LRRAIAAGKLREEPLELLVLSACHTASGDERAALGLAGVALASGARSALASLWAVSDESTAFLMTRFYEYLARDGMTKAAALRQAQLDLSREDRFSHPAYWAAFLLIGNWL